MMHYSNTSPKKKKKIKIIKRKLLKTIYQLHNEKLNETFNLSKEEYNNLSNIGIIDPDYELRIIKKYEYYK